MIDKKHAGKGEHGTIRNYVIGFVLSLIFTLVPYFLVVNEALPGQALLIAILTLAVVQLIIQIVYFLHLGRGPKPDWNLYFFISTVAIILVVVGGSIVITQNLHGNMASYDQTKRLIDREGIYQISGEMTGACKGRYNNYKVIIENGRVSPLFTVASQCDTLTFINKDSGERELTFGEYPRQDAYAGEDEIVIRKGRNKTITLSQTGTFKFHDHSQPSTAGSFTVVGNN